MILSALLLALIVWFWMTSLTARELAIKTASEMCDSVNYQLLENSVSFQSLYFRRSESGRLMLQRHYLFEYSEDCVDRKNGFVIVYGKTVVGAGFMEGLQ
jgi:hypothetical protein